MTDVETPRVDGYSSAVTDATELAERALGEARLPIHILLTAQFGELNENQEEMLRAAQTALDDVAGELRTLRDLAAPAGNGQRASGEIIRISDVMQDLQPQLREQAARAGVSLPFSIQPALPSVMGLPARVRDAIRIALMDEIRYAAPGSTVRIDAHSANDGIVISASSGVSRSATAALLLAKRLLGSHGATLDQRDGQVIITFATTQT